MQTQKLDETDTKARVQTAKMEVFIEKRETVLKEIADLKETTVRSISDLNIVTLISFVFY